MRRVLPHPRGPRINRDSRLPKAADRRCCSLAMPTRGNSGSIKISATLRRARSIAPCSSGCGPCRPAGGRVFLYSRMPGEADHQEVDAVLLDEIADRLHGVPRNNYGLQVHGPHRGSRAAVGGELPKIAIGAVFLLAEFVDYLRVAGQILLHANHAEAGSQSRGKRYRGVEGFSRAIGAIVRNQDLFEHITSPNLRLRAPRP